MVIDGEKVCLLELPDTDVNKRLSCFSYRNQALFASADAHAGLDQVEGASQSDLSVLIDECLKYVQRLEEIVDGFHPAGDSRLPRVPWAAALAELAESSPAELMRKPLIITLAENQMYPLREIARGAKRILRRKRGMERLARAREFDKASMIRLAQLPGRTIAEKAGPRQRVPAVVRYESTDTLENRVVEHFCRLSQAEWNRTRSSSVTAVSREWQELAISYVRLCDRVAAGEDLKDLPKLKAPCAAPNFTLEQNINYRAIWVGYQKLVRREQEREECWAWVRRLFLNRALTFAAELFESAFPESDSVYVPYRKDLRMTQSNQYGLWLLADSLPGPRIVRSVSAGRETSAYMLSPGDVVAALGFDSKILLCNADAYYLAADGSRIRACPIYSFVGGSAIGAWQKAATDLIEVNHRLSSEFGSSGSIEYVEPLFLWADFLNQSNLAADEFPGVLHQGIPIISDEWVSPSGEMIKRLRNNLSA